MDIQKLSKSIGIERATVLKYLKYLEEAKLIIRLFQNLDRVGALQKPDKDFSQVSNEPDAYVAADDIDSAIGKKIPLWAFGMLY